MEIHVYYSHSLDAKPSAWLCLLLPSLLFPQLPIPSFSSYFQQNDRNLHVLHCNPHVALVIECGVRRVCGWGGTSVLCAYYTSRKTVGPEKKGQPELSRKREAAV